MRVRSELDFRSTQAIIAREGSVEHVRKIEAFAV